MNRRQCLVTLSALPCLALPGLPALAAVAKQEPNYRRLLILVELKGGNDGLNTLVPYADAQYYALRPQLAIARDQVLKLDTQVGFHPALEPLLPLWQAKELAVMQGLGYPAPNLSHFRSIEIWDTASSSTQYLQQGWLARAFAAAPPPASFAAEGVVVAASDLGPLAGGARAISLANTDQFLRQAKLAAARGEAKNPALEHLLKVESDIVQAAEKLDSRYVFQTQFPAHPFGQAVRAAATVVAQPAGVAVLRLSLAGFDTHHGQLPAQAKLLKDLAEGLVALRAALLELGRWQDALILTYAEFGRRPKENASQGTDHGTANVHFALGGKVRGGLLGAAPALDRLTGEGNLLHTVDFRSVYATVLERWWGIPASAILNGKFAPLDFLRT